MLLILSIFTACNTFTKNQTAENLSIEKRNEIAAEIIKRNQALIKSWVSDDPFDNGMELYANEKHETWINNSELENPLLLLRHCYEITIENQQMLLC